MGRDRQPFFREQEYLDARKIIVIAFEGAKDKAEDRYFLGMQSLANDLCKPDTPRIHIKSIPNEHNRSAPHHIYDNLKKFTENYELDYAENESFLLIDWDNHEDNIKNHQLIELCEKSQFHFILCKPCFELWLLLHFVDVNSCSEEEKWKILENRRTSNAKHYVDRLLHSKCGTSNKANLNFKKYENYITTAIANAKKLEIKRDIKAIPDGLAARAFIIVENILGKCKDPENDVEQLV